MEEKPASEFRTGQELSRLSPRSASVKKDGSGKPARGWQIRCLKCSFTGWWAEPDIRLRLIERTDTFGRCLQCKRSRIIKKISRWNGGLASSRIRWVQGRPDRRGRFDRLANGFTCYPPPEAAGCDMRIA